MTEVLDGRTARFRLAEGFCPWEGHPALQRRPDRFGWCPRCGYLYRLDGPMTISVDRPEGSAPGPCPGPGAFHG